MKEINIKTFTIITIFSLLFCLSCNGSVQVIEGWEGLLSSDSEIRKNTVKYLESLSKEDLIEQSKNCSEYLSTENSNPYDVYHLLRIFDIASKKGFDGSNAVDLIQMQDITNSFRIGLFAWINEVGYKSISWDKNIELFDFCIQELKDKSRYFKIRKLSSYTIRQLLTNAETKDFFAEPIVSDKIRQGIAISEIKKQFWDGRITLSKNYTISQIEKISLYDRYSKVLLSVVNEIDIEPNLQSEILKGLCLCLEKPIELNANIYQILEYSVRNYQNFDKTNWRQLALIGFDIIKLKDADNILKDIINKLETKLETENDSSIKFYLQNEIKSLNRISDETGKKISIEGYKAWKAPEPLMSPVEPKSVEPVDVNEIIDWLEQIRLEDETINNIMDANQWQEFIEAIKQN